MTFAKFSELRSNPVPDPILSWMDEIERKQAERHAWLIEAGEKLRGDCAARTAAGQQSPSQVPQSRPCRVTIDYRKGETQ